MGNQQYSTINKDDKDYQITDEEKTIYEKNKKYLHLFTFQMIKQNLLLVFHLVLSISSILRVSSLKSMTLVSPQKKKNLLSLKMLWISLMIRLFQKSNNYSHSMIDFVLLCW